MTILTTAMVQGAVAACGAPGRAPWKSKPITDKQFKRLSDYVEVDTLAKIDRGGAACLINILTSLSELGIEGDGSE
jgi:hypothetical protein